MSRYVQETIFAAACIVLGTVFWTNTGELIPSAALFPKIAIGAVVFFSCWMMYQAWAARRTEPLPEAEKGDAPRFQTTRLVVFFLLCLGYAGSIEYLGYFLATPLFIIISYRYLRSVRLHVSLLAAVGFSAAVYVLFVRFLHIPLPLGICEPLLEAWL